jgi:hypothetical protein
MVSIAPVRTYVGSTTGVSKSGFVPLVTIEMENMDGHSFSCMVTPEQARAIGVQLLEVAVITIADARLRTIAKDHGIDGDTIITDLTEAVVKHLPGIEFGMDDDG